MNKVILNSVVTAGVGRGAKSSISTTLEVMVSMTSRIYANAFVAIVAAFTSYAVYHVASLWTWVLAITIVITFSVVVEHSIWHDYHGIDVSIAHF